MSPGTKRAWGGIWTPNPAQEPTVTNREPNPHTSSPELSSLDYYQVWRTKGSLKGSFFFFLLKGDDVITCNLGNKFHAEMTVITKGPASNWREKKFDFIMKYWCKLWNVKWSDWENVLQNLTAFWMCLNIAQSREYIRKI